MSNLLVTVHQSACKHVAALNCLIYCVCCLAVLEIAFYFKGVIMVFWNVIAFGKSSKHFLKFSSISYESQSFVHRGLYLGLEVLHLFYTVNRKLKWKAKCKMSSGSMPVLNLMYQYLFFRLWEAYSVNFLLHEQLL